MGQAPPSKPLKEPARPFQREQRRACLQHTFLPKPRKDPTVLLHLISRREWQKVLIRVTLFPSEVTQRQKMTWYGVQWSLIPLHLACALQPPSEVVAMLLRFHSDTARVRMNRCSPPPQKKKKRSVWRRAKKTRKKGPDDSEQNDYAMIQSMQGLSVVPKINTAPSSSSDDEAAEEEHSEVPHNATMETEKAHNRNTSYSDSGSLLDDEAFAMEGDKSRLHVFETYDDDESSVSEDEHDHSAFGMPPDMLPDYEEAPAPDYAVQNGKNEALKKSLSDHGVALQLSSNGSLEPLSVNSGNAAVQSKMQWNLDPLLMEADALMPLHIACLYRASPSVISALLEAYPKAAQDSALGMLPIHMVCANFDLPPPLLAPPPGPVPFPHDDEFDMVESIRRLQKSFPESLDYPSESNGMTPKTYIEETLDDGAYKESCLEALGIVKEESIEEEEDEDENEIAESRVSDYDNTTLTTRPPDEVHFEDDNSTLPSYQTDASTQYLGQDLPQINGFSGSRLYTQMVTKDWESALATIEERPKEARNWQYGIELDRIETSDSAIMWKRLPIHSACVLRAPIGLIEALLWAYPKGIQVKDPFTGSLPLHMACRHSAPPELVKIIVMAYPVGARITDAVGRLPLHTACLSGASRLTFIYLLKAYPHAVLIKDDQRRTPLKYAKRNPTLKPETVELLELVHHFLEKQPAVEDDYIFEGFSGPHSVHGSDDGSTVSSFYQESFSVGRRSSPYAEGSKGDSPSSGSRLLQEDTNVDKLADEFSQILEDDTKAPDGEDDISGRITPKFGVSRLKKEKEQAHLDRVQSEDVATEELLPIKEDENSFEPEVTVEAEGAAATLSKLVSLHDTDDNNEQNAEDSEEETSLITVDVKSETSGPVEAEKGAAITLAKLVFLTNKRETEQAITTSSVKTGALSKELSQILEEDSSAAEEESHTEDDTSVGEAVETNESLVAKKRMADRGKVVVDSETSSAEVSLVPTEPPAKVESPLVRLSKLLTARNDDDKGPASSVTCLGGDQYGSDSHEQSSSTDSVENTAEASDEVEKRKPNVKETIFDESPRSIQDFTQEFSSSDEGNEDIEHTRTVVVDPTEQDENESFVGGSQEVTIEKDNNEVADIPSDVCGGDTDNTESEGFKAPLSAEVPAQHADETVVDADSDESKAPPSDENVTDGAVGEESRPSSEVQDDDRKEDYVKDIPPSAKESTNDTDNDSAHGSIPSPKDGAPPQPMVFDPADVAAGCSPLTLPTIESLKRDHSEVTVVTNNRSTAVVKRAGTAQYVALEDEASVPYEPLLDETDNAKAAETIPNNGGIQKNETASALINVQATTEARIVLKEPPDGAVNAASASKESSDEPITKDSIDSIDVGSTTGIPSDSPVVDDTIEEGDDQ